MNLYLKYSLPLLILFLAICCGSIVINSHFSIGMDVKSVLILIASFAFTTLVSLIVFIRGLPRKAGEQAMHTFVAVSVKFLAELFISLIWFVAGKKTSADYILLFFVLYLAFSLFFVTVVLKTLKKKSL
jgi:hypothetical protein